MSISLSPVIGKICYPFFSRAAQNICKDCEPYIKKGSKILDLGCGHGIPSLAIKEHFKADLLGVDVSDQRITDFPFRLMDGKTLPFPSNSFDVVFITHVLHHTNNYLDLLKEAKRVSKKTIIIYEDLPEGFLSNFFCKTHGVLFNIFCMLKGGENNFKTEKQWLEIFNTLNLGVVHKKRLKVNFYYPIKYIHFVLAKNNEK